MVPVTDSMRVRRPPVFELVAATVRRTVALKSVRVRNTKKERPEGLSFLVPVTGLEPVRCCQRRILSPVMGLEACGIPEKSVEYYGTEKCSYTNVFSCFIVENRTRAPPSETTPKVAVDRFLIDEEGD